MTDLDFYLGSTKKKMSDFGQVISTLCLSYLMGTVVTIIIVLTVVSKLKLDSDYKSTL